MPILVFRDANDTPLPFAKVYSYLANTTTPAALFQDPAGATPHSNPAICDASGRLVAYGTVGQAYKLNVLDQNNVQVPGWPIDSVMITPASSLTLLDDHAATVPEFRLTHDPGAPGAENLPTNAAQEIESLRY